MKGHIEEEKIALLAGGDLAVSEMPAAAAHVARCGSCSAVLESYRQRRQAIAAFRDFGISAGDFAHIRQSVLELLPRESRSHFRFFTRPLLTPLQYGALAALLLAAVAIGTFGWKKAHAPQLAGRVAPIKISPQASIPPSTDGRVDLTAKPVAAQTAAQNPDRQARRGRQPTASVTAPPAAEAAVDPQIQTHQATLPDDVAMKLETSDPNVIIIWLASPKGAGR
jgi:hypothetical protein